jgi:hypothetical protein
MAAPPACYPDSVVSNAAGIWATVPADHHRYLDLGLAAGRLPPMAPSSCRAATARHALCPPGHHAADVAASFYYINNAALAANSHRAGKRTAILDIDVHRPAAGHLLIADVLTVSIHAHPKRSV